MQVRGVGCVGGEVGGQAAEHDVSYRWLAGDDVVAVEWSLVDRVFAGMQDDSDMIVVRWLSSTIGFVVESTQTTAAVLSSWSEGAAL